jgi:hypothetical protein
MGEIEDEGNVVAPAARYIFFELIRVKLGLFLIYFCL